MRARALRRRCVFLFPFYYMLIGSLQEEPDTRCAARSPPADFTCDNYSADQRPGRTWLQSLVNSGIFTGGVLLGTVVFGVLAGYALARLHFRGQRHPLRRHAAGADHPVPAADHPAST